MDDWQGPGTPSRPLPEEFRPPRPLWFSVMLGAVGLAVLVAIFVYALVRL